MAKGLIPSQLVAIVSHTNKEEPWDWDESFGVPAEEEQGDELRERVANRLKVFKR